MVDRITRKTQIAVEYEYAYRRRDADPDLWVFWVHAANKTRFEDSFRDIAQHLRLDGAQDPQTDILQLVFIWLSNEHNGKWTLILDNADYSSVFFENDKKADRTRKSLSTYLPESPNGSLLITSRNQEVVLDLGTFHQDACSLGAMNEAQSVSLFMHRLKDDVSKTITSTEVEGLVSELGCVPLAVSHAAAYIAERYPMTTVSDYLKMLKSDDTNRSSLLKHNGREPQRDQESSNSIFTTWQISFKHIEELHPEAAEVLSFMCVCDRQSIQHSLLLEYSKQNPGAHEREPESTSSSPEADLSSGTLDVRCHETRFGTRIKLKNGVRTLLLRSKNSQSRSTSVYALKNSVAAVEAQNGRIDIEDSLTTILSEAEAAEKLQKAVLLLRSFRLIDLSPDASSFSMHRLVQHATRDWLQLSGRLGNWQDTMVTALHKLTPEWARKREEVTFNKTQSEMLSMLPHLQAVMAHTPNRQGIIDNFVDLLLHHCWYAHEVGQYEIAEALARRSLQICESKYDFGHWRTRNSLARLYDTLRDSKQYEEACQVAQKILQLVQEVLEPERENTLHAMVQLAEAYADCKKLLEAEAILRKALQVQQRKSGRCHADTLYCRGQLTEVLLRQGKLKEAEDLQLQVLPYWKPICKEDYSYWNPWYNLAEVYNHQGKFDEAYELLATQLEWCKSHFGGQHWHTAWALQRVALIAWKQVICLRQETRTSRR